jgi:hypothetical protein
MAATPLEQFRNIKRNYLDEPKGAIQRVMTNYAILSISKAKGILDRQGKTGALSASIRPEIRVLQDGVVELTVRANEYWDFVNSGVDGTQVKYGSPYSYKTKQPPMEAIKKWFAFKGINSMRMTDSAGRIREVRLTTDNQYKALAYVIARSIKRKGIKPSYFADEAFSQESIDELLETIADLWQ